MQLCVEIKLQGGELRWIDNLWNSSFQRTLRWALSATSMTWAILPGSISSRMNGFIGLGSYKMVWKAFNENNNIIFIRLVTSDNLESLASLKHVGAVKFVYQNTWIIENIAQVRLWFHLCIDRIVVICMHVSYSSYHSRLCRKLVWQSTKPSNRVSVPLLHSVDSFWERASCAEAFRTCLKKFCLQKLKWPFQLLLLSCAMTKWLRIRNHHGF